MAEDRDVLDLLHEILETERAFYQVIRFLDSASRNHLVAAQMRNTNVALNLLRTYATTPPVANMVFNIPLGHNDASGNFFDPVPVVPTGEQIASAVERNVSVAETTCAICQENVTDATRIRACGHSFHDLCIMQWLGVNTRCPVCRHDVRNLQTAVRNVNNGEDRRVHPNSQP